MFALNSGLQARLYFASYHKAILQEYLIIGPCRLIFFIAFSLSVYRVLWENFEKSRNRKTSFSLNGTNASAVKKVTLHEIVVEWGIRASCTKHKNKTNGIAFMGESSVRWDVEMIWCRSRPQKLSWCSSN